MPTCPARPTRSDEPARALWVRAVATVRHLHSLITVRWGRGDAPGGRRYYAPCECCRRIQVLPPSGSGWTPFLKGLGWLDLPGYSDHGLRHLCPFCRVVVDNLLRSMSPSEMDELRAQLNLRH